MEILFQALTPGNILIIGLFSGAMGAFISRKNGPELYFFRGGVCTYLRSSENALYLHVLFSLILISCAIISTSWYFSGFTVGIFCPIFFWAWSLIYFLSIARKKKDEAAFVTKVFRCSACTCFWTSLSLTSFLYKNVTDVSFIYYPVIVAIITFSSWMLGCWFMSQVGINDMID